MRGSRRFWIKRSAQSETSERKVKMRKEKIDVKFVKVKSHSNDHYNDIADKLAKEALGIK